MPISVAHPRIRAGTSGSVQPSEIKLSGINVISSDSLRVLLRVVLPKQIYESRCNPQLTVTKTCKGRGDFKNLPGRISMQEGDSTTFSRERGETMNATNARRQLWGTTATTNLINIADHSWRFQKGKTFMALKDGTTGRSIPFDDPQKRRPMPSDPLASAQQNRQPDHSTPPQPLFNRAEKPTRFLIDEGRYEAICTNVRDPHWVPRWGKYQVRLEFALCGKTTPPLVQFVNCGKDKEAAVIDGWLLQTLDAIGAQSPKELQGRDFYVDVATTKRDQRGRPLPRHEWYSKVCGSSLITGEQDLVD